MFPLLLLLMLIKNVFQLRNTHMFPLLLLLLLMAISFIKLIHCLNNSWIIQRRWWSI